jgi:hypothetical protein
MAGPTKSRLDLVIAKMSDVQTGLKISLQSMLENMQQFHFTANNIPENPASRADLN